MDSFDYIVIGAGSAGCVLANRLTEDGRHTVLVVEYGGSDNSLFIRMPSALSIPMNDARYNWFYRTEPEPNLNHRRLHTPRGKVLGGSSSINGLVYVRGNPLDFESWQAAGARGWGWQDVLPYFRRAETRGEGGDAYRGDAGPLHTNYGPLRNPLYRTWIEAGKQAGYPGDGRLQWLSAGRLRPHGYDGAAGPPLQRCCRLPETRDAAEELGGTDTRFSVQG